MDKATIEIRFHVTPEQNKVIQQVLQDKCISRSDLMRDALEFYIGEKTLEWFPLPVLKSGRPKKTQTPRP